MVFFYQIVVCRLKLCLFIAKVYAEKCNNYSQRASLNPLKTIVLVCYRYLFILICRKYIRVMYWSLMTLTTIGERPPPETDLVSMPLIFYSVSRKNAHSYQRVFYICTCIAKTLSYNVSMKITKDRW